MNLTENKLYQDIRKDLENKVLKHIKKELDAVDQAEAARQQLAARTREYEDQIEKLTKEHAATDKVLNEKILSGASQTEISRESTKLKNLARRIAELKDISRRLETGNLEGVARQRYVAARQELSDAFNNKIVQMRQQYIARLMKTLSEAAALASTWNGAVNILSAEKFIKVVGGWAGNDKLAIRDAFTTQEQVTQVLYLRNLLQEQLTYEGHLFQGLPETAETAEDVATKAKRD